MARSPGAGLRTLRGGFRHLALGDVGSTNVEAFERARAGDPGGLWVTAERQLAGRGRRGRPWVSEKGNLYATALLIDPCPVERLAELPLVAAVAVHRAIRAAAGPALGREVAIKWPNDTLVRGRKASGILLETNRLDGGALAVAIGYGINCAHYPAVSETPATSLLQEGVSIFPEQILDLLAEALSDTLAVWDGGRGFGEIRAAWMAAVHGVGRPIRVRLVDRELNGVFAALDEQGRLVLDLGDGTRMTISAGDVFFPATATETPVTTGGTL